MILDITRGHIKVKIGGKTVTLQGEMFFPGNDKMGFVLYRNSIKNWDEPNQDLPITPDEVDAIMDDIRNDFAKGGHTFEVE